MYNDNIKYIKLAQECNEEAMEKLIKNNSGLIWNIVKRFVGRLTVYWHSVHSCE